MIGELEASAARNDTPGKQKSRRKRAPVVSGCVGLLTNRSPGDWPEYPLFSHPRTTKTARNRFKYGFRGSYMVRLHVYEVNKLRVLPYDIPR